MQRNKMIGAIWFNSVPIKSMSNIKVEEHRAW